MRMRKRKWVSSFIENETIFLLRNYIFPNEIKTFRSKFLEIGSGLCDFIVQKAKNNPDCLFFAYEKDITCVAKGIKKAIEHDLKNLFFINDDASNLLSWFENLKVDGIYLLFSDPWPKKGYFKRRLTYFQFLNKYEQILNDQGFIFFKTDDENLYNFSLEEIGKTNLSVKKISTNYHKDFNSNEAISLYEKKFIALNKQIYFIYAIK